MICRVRAAIAALCVSVCGIAFAQSGAIESRPGRLVPLIADPGISTLRVRPPANFAPGGKAAKAAATIIVNFRAVDSECNTSWDSNLPAKSAFAYAASLWASQIQSPVTITVDACFSSSLGSGVLGAAGPGTLYRGFPGAPNSATWYPKALANAISGADINATIPDIRATFSSTFSWYYGTDGNTPFSSYDFVSVVLHELGHGLGFLGLMDNNAGLGAWGNGSGFPSIYDRFTVSSNGTSLINTGVFPNPSVALGTVLTSGAVFFNGTNANAANGGVRVPLYAPAVWSDGSSYAHLAEGYNNTPNALMTYSLSNGESIHSPGPVTLGLFQDMGWTLNPTGPVNPSLGVTRLGGGNGQVTSDPGGLNCGPTCSVAFPTNTVVALTATPGFGSFFAGWGGACGGTGACSVTMDVSKSVTATFNVASVPSTPVITSIGSGLASLIVNFTVASNGGLPITSYAATCTAPGRTTVVGVSTVSPVIVTGLAEGVSYTCTVRASNAVGSSAASAAAANITLTQAQIAPLLPLLFD